jgi:DNA repair photolyase
MASGTPERVHGRGAQSSALSQRLSGRSYQTEDDWRNYVAALEGPPVKLRTQVVEERPRSILTFNQSPDIPFDRSVNPYRGCEHGCIYCFARPTHAYHDHSPGLDFETILYAKPDAARLLRETLNKPRYQPRPIALGTNTDPYQPIEKRYRITRSLLEVCLDTLHPVTITTKSDRVLADIDLLEELARHRLVAVAISITSLDPVLSGKLEPRAAAPAKRLAALDKLIQAGVPVHCSISPVIPAITDNFLEAIVSECASLGVHSIGWIPLRLPHEVAPLFREWLAVHYPDRAAKVMSIVRDMRGGRDNDPSFFTRMKPTGVWADLFAARFRTASRKAGVGKAKLELDCSQFRPPLDQGQLRLF